MNDEGPRPRGRFTRRLLLVLLELAALALLGTPGEFFPPPLRVSAGPCHLVGGEQPQAHEEENGKGGPTGHPGLIRRAVVAEGTFDDVPGPCPALAHAPVGRAVGPPAAGAGALSRLPASVTSRHWLTSFPKRCRPPRHPASSTPRAGPARKQKRGVCRNPYPLMRRARA
jgi:hypothetical protein